MHLHLHLNAPTLISIYFLWNVFSLYDFEYSLPGIVQQIGGLSSVVFWPSKKGKSKPGKQFWRPRKPLIGYRLMRERSSYTSHIY